MSILLRLGVVFYLIVLVQLDLDEDNLQTSSTSYHGIIYYSKSRCRNSWTHLKHVSPSYRNPWVISYRKTVRKLKLIPLNSPAAQSIWSQLNYGPMKLYKYTRRPCPAIPVKIIHRIKATTRKPRSWFPPVNCHSCSHHSHKKEKKTKPKTDDEKKSKKPKKKDPARYNSKYYKGIGNDTGPISKPPDSAAMTGYKTFYEGGNHNKYFKIWMREDEDKKDASDDEE